jgi:hypothetical protein
MCGKDADQNIEVLPASGPVSKRDAIKTFWIFMNKPMPTMTDHPGGKTKEVSTL